MKGKISEPENISVDCERNTQIGGELWSSVTYSVVIADYSCCTAEQLSC